MIYLLIVSLIWAFSFGLIKGSLTGLDSNFVAFSRMGLSLMIFLPFFRLNNLRLKTSLQLLITGMIQYGLMYVSYIYSYQYLKAYQVALFTIFTPLYVTLINDLFRKMFNRRNMLSAVVAVIGTAVIVFREIGQADLQMGFVLMQISNISFAFGQIYYRNIRKQNENLNDRQVFALLYFGAVIVTAAFSFATTNYGSLQVSGKQMLVLLYLGILASGICFFLWNFGATKVKAGTLAVFNNLKIPLAVLFAILFFGEQGNLVRLMTGGSIIALAFRLNRVNAGGTKKKD